MEENTNRKEDLRKPEKWDVMEVFPIHIIERIEAECFQVAKLDPAISDFNDTDDFHIKQWSRLFDDYLFSAINAYLPYFQRGQSEEGLILALQYFRHMTHPSSQAEDIRTYFRHYVITVLKILYPDTKSRYDIRMHREHPFLLHLVQKLSGEFM